MSKYLFRFPLEPYMIDTTMYKDESTAKYQPKRALKIKNKIKRKRKKK